MGAGYRDLGITIAGIFDGKIMLGMASIVGGALALVTAVLTKQQTNREKEIKT